MRTDMYDAPYDPVLDVGAPVTSPPHWSIITGMLVTVLSAGLTATLSTYELLRTDPLKALILIVSAMATSAVSVLGVGFIQGRKETVAIESAVKIGILKAQTRGEVAIVAARANAGLGDPASPALTPAAEMPAEAQAEAIVTEIGDRLQDG